MKGNLARLLMLILVITPVASVIYAGSVGSANAALATPDDDLVQQDTDINDVQFDTMLFTETRSSEGGFNYVARKGMTPVAYFGASSVTYLSGASVFTVEFPGSNSVIPEVENPTGSVTNYLIGNDPSEWKTGIHDHSVLRYDGLYPGIDLVYEFQDGSMKYEFVVAPNADPDVIQMRYMNAEFLDVNGNSITISRDGSSLSDAGLVVLQDDSSKVDCRFTRYDSNTIRFDVGYYDIAKELVIDPFLDFSTYLGGTGGDRGYSIAVEQGYIYVTGRTGSTDFPVASAFNATDAPADDAFVTKFAPDGQSLVYSTYLGGNGIDSANDIAVDAGEVYVTGFTLSSNFPTLNAYDDTYGGNSNQDGFVTKLKKGGDSLAYSTYIGGTGNDAAHSIAVEAGSAYISGDTDKEDFPTLNGFNMTHGGNYDAFVTKFSVDGLSLEYSAFFGGAGVDSSSGIAVEGGYAYITGQTYSADLQLVSPYQDSLHGTNDSYVAKVGISGKNLIFSTYLGGSATDYGRSIAVENGYAYIVGGTSSTDYPTLNAYDDTYNTNYDIVVTKFDLDGRDILYSTYLGGSDADSPKDIAVDNGYAFILGDSSSSDFPLIDNIASGGGAIDVAVALLGPSGGTLHFSTLFGGISNDQAFGVAFSGGSIHITGVTQSTNFPVQDALYPTSSGGGMDAFVTKISFYDNDHDGLTNWDELVHGTDKDLIDTDNDNFLDAYEVAYGSDPLDANSYPAMPQVWYDAIYADLDGNATLVQNLIAWTNGNSSLLQTVMQQLHDNATLVTQVISWLDGNHTAIETLFTQLEGNATLLATMVTALDGNSTLIQYLLSWSAGNETLLLNLIDQVNAIEQDDLTQIMAWLDGNHTAIETLFTYVEGNATLLLSTVARVNGNEGQLDILAALITGNTAYLNSLNATHFSDFDSVRSAIDEIRAVMTQLGVSVGDSDYDGLDDLDEVAYGTNLLCSDTDTDNLNDAFEVKIGTDPLNDDSDADTYLDGIEVMAGSDPLNPLSYPGAAQGFNPTIIVAAVGGIGVVFVVIVLFARRMRSRV